MTITKLEVLRELATAGGMTARDVVVRFKVGEKAAENMLRRLHGQGLVQLASRARIFMASRFTITDRGRQRLEFKAGGRRGGTIRFR